MDTFVDSSWYFMRYCDPKNDQAMVGEGAQYWMPMDQYIGGIEHAILHLLYARFWTKVMRDLGLVKIDEPFTKLLTQGMVLNEAFSRTGDKAGKQYYWAHELDIVRDEHAKVISATAKADGQPVTYEGWTTMSKSKNNGVDPQDLIEKYGADTARLYTMFTAPPEATLEWNDAALEGCYRFLRRVWNFGLKLRRRRAAPQRRRRSAVGKQAKALRREIHTVLRQVDYDYQRMQYNTVVSGAMKMLNALEDFKARGRAGRRRGAARRLRHPAARAVPGHAAHRARAVAGAGLRGRARRPARRALAAGRRAGAGAGRDRAGAAGQRQAPRLGAGAGRRRQGGDRAAGAWPARPSPSSPAARAPKKVIVVPGRLVNVVV